MVTARSKMLPEAAKAFTPACTPGSASLRERSFRLLISHSVYYLLKLDQLRFALSRFYIELQKHRFCGEATDDTAPPDDSYSTGITLPPDDRSSNAARCSIGDVALIAMGPLILWPRLVQRELLTRALPPAVSVRKHRPGGRR